MPKPWITRHHNIAANASLIAAYVRNAYTAENAETGVSVIASRGSGVAIYGDNAERGSVLPGNLDVGRDKAKPFPASASNAAFMLAHVETQNKRVEHLMVFRALTI